MLILPPLPPARIADMGDLRRWHTRRVARPQNLLEHSASVALLALYLAGPELDDCEKADLLHLALVHDAHETEFGDLPYPARQELFRRGVPYDEMGMRAYWGTNPYMQVSDRVLDLVEVADALEAALWSQRHALAPDLAYSALERAAHEAKARLDGAPLRRAMEALEIPMEVEP